MFSGFLSAQPIRAAFNVCVVKSGLSRAIPDAITTSRKTHVDRFHAVVSSSARQDISLGNNEAEKTDREGQFFSSIVANDANSWGAEAPINFGHGRSLQQLAAPVPDSAPSFETNMPSSLQLSVSYFETMPYSLLPFFAGLGILVLLVPLFLLLFCLRNCSCSKRLCSCFCCLRIFFKSTKRYAVVAERWQSNGSSTAASDSHYRGSVRKLVPRSSCVGMRYLVLILAFCTVAAALAVGMYLVVDMRAQLSQLACSAGQAASTIINGQTFANPSASSPPDLGVLSSPSPFVSPTLFNSASPSAPAVANRPSPFSPLLQPAAVADRTADRFPYLGEAIGAGQAFPRLLQEDDADLSEEATAPKRTGFIGAVPALAYFENLFMALDPNGEASLSKQLRMATKVAARINETVAEMKINLQALKKTLRRRGNSGMAASGGSAENEELTFHIAPVSVAAPSLLSSFDTAVHLLPSTFFAIAEASEQLAAEIETSVRQADGLAAVRDLQTAKEALSQTLRSAHPAVDKIPKLSTPLFWVSIVTFSLMGVLVLLASLYLCCLCCCNREALVDRKATSCSCSFLLLLVAAAALLASGGLLVGSTMLTDGCLYTEAFLKDEKDVQQLLQYFWGMGSGGAPLKGPMQAPSSAAAKVLAACLLPNKERDLVRVFNIDELVKAGAKMREAGRAAVEKEALAARLVSLQLQDAAAELQVLRDTYWLLLIDPVTLEQEVRPQPRITAAATTAPTAAAAAAAAAAIPTGLDERLDTYKEVLCSGVQDKQRELRASYLGLFPAAAAKAAAAAAAAAAEAKAPTPQGEKEQLLLNRQNMFSLLQQHELQPSDELAALLQQLSADPLAADRLSASFQEAIREMEDSSSSSSSSNSSSSSSSNRRERVMKPMIEGVVGELMRLAADKTEAEKTQLLHAVVRLAGQAHAEVQAAREANSSSSSSSSSSRAAAVKQRRQQKQQRSMLLQLLQEKCMHAGQTKADRLVVCDTERPSNTRRTEIETETETETDIEIEKETDVQIEKEIRIKIDKETTIDTNITIETETEKETEKETEETEKETEKETETNRAAGRHRTRATETDSWRQTKTKKDR
ncbi:uncharacterized protein EMH_0010480 [Eimeria mitis]|uniref:Transmembrane protein n=1 Tax=Eimeria mitis TaxID=44415 RepID=U6K8S3_9EIME|nr:uncharacterized protein EMH_0010480 [Eimeria mitis]CDJ31863.1 hypothetical protein, conserved [Eimeria mitis]